MDPRDDDIQFDFFEDEPPTTEMTAQTRVRLPRRGGRGGSPRRPAGPARGFTPLLRLLALIAIVIAVLVFFGLVLQSCASTSKHDEYSHYMNKVATIARSSAGDGTSVATILTTPGLKATDLSSKLSGIAEQERQNVAAAQGLDAPGPLRDENRNLVEALQLRVSGTQGLADAFKSTAASTSSSDANLLVMQADRLLASDVVYADLFAKPTLTELQSEGVSGVAVPESQYVVNPDLITPVSMSGVLQRLRGASTGGTVTGLHGTNIGAVVANPGHHVLSASTENTAIAATNTAFAVTIHDGGDSQEVGIKVTLTIQRSPASGKSITKTETVRVIDSGKDATVTFANLDVSQFIAQKAQVSVDVSAVRGEHDRSNNHATYPVIFSLPG